MAIALLLIVLAAYILFKPQFKTIFIKLKPLLIKDISKTPQGAGMIYNKAIVEKENEYNRAFAVLQQVNTAISSEKNRATLLESSVKKLEQKCENLVNTGHLEQAKIIAKERLDLSYGLETIRQNIENLERSQAEAKEVSGILYEELQQLKREKERIINDLIVGKQLNDAYNSLSNLRRSDDTMRSLEKVKESAMEEKARAASSKILQETFHNPDIASLYEEPKDRSDEHMT
ncbi:MAG: hypothetical protein Q8942_09725 [Bacillota bacterium]|nr:hypothetical protein [Bacillota bacterium]